MTCRMKRRYRDEIAAKLALANIQAKDSPKRPKTEQRAYPCGGHWHLTSEERRT